MAAITTAACGSDIPQEVTRLKIDPSHVVQSVGRLDGAPEAAILSGIRAAELSEDGRYLAIANGSPPFLRIFDRSSDSIWSFGSGGEGPGELRAPWGMSWLGDTAIVVLSGVRLDRFTIAGAWRGAIRLPDRGLVGMSVMTGCGDHVYVYGVPTGYAGMDPVPWVHEMPMDSISQPRPMLFVPGRAVGSVRFGARLGVDGTERGLFVWHRDIPTRKEAGYWVPCDGSEPHMVDGTPTSEQPNRAADRSSGVVLTLPDTMFSGAAAGAAEMLRAESWTEEANVVTRLIAMGDRGCSAVELIGEWVLKDLGETVLVLADQEPFPRVQLIDWKWLRDQMVAVPCHAN